MNKLFNSITSRLLTGASLILSLVFANSGVQAAGLMRPVDGSLPALEILSQDVSVVIEDGYAITHVDQVFFNSNKTDLEAIYEFPVPENGTIAEYTVWIDGQPVVGEVVERAQAEKIYEAEKSAGRDSGIAQKHEFYRFQTHVNPVRAGQQTKTRIVYMQPADVDGGIGRYVYPLKDGGTDEQKNAFWSTDSQVKQRFGFDLKLRSGYPVDAVRVPTQPNAAINRSDAHDWSIVLGQVGSRPTATDNTAELPRQDDGSRQAAFKNTEATDTPVSIDEVSQEQSSATSERVDQTGTGASSHLNEDIVVYWRLAQGLPGSVDMVTYREANAQQGTFMMTVTPGVDLQPISSGRDWVFVLDTSGSMEMKLLSLVEGVSAALAQLPVGDRYRVVLFNNNVRELNSGWLQVSEDNVRRTVSNLQNINADGGTNLYAGLETAIALLDSDRTSGIVLVTDGVANVGTTEREAFIKLLDKRDVRLFTAIMGNGSDRPLLQKMADVSKGFATSVSTRDDIQGLLLKAAAKVSHEALHDVSVQIDGVSTANVTPKEPSTLYRGEQLVLLGHYEGTGPADVILSAKISGEDKVYRTRFDFPEVATEHPELERLWAFSAIEAIRDRSQYLGTDPAEDKAAITDLAINYGLVTDFTSMVVMRDEQFEAQGIKRRNRDRRAKETASAEQRASQPAQSRRVDSQQPMFTENAPSHTGGGGGGAGAMGPMWLLTVLVLVLWVAGRRRR